MSSIGSGPLGIPPLVSSAAGVAGQQKSAETNRVNQDGNVQKFQLDRADQFEQTVGDVSASNETDERDADGRMPWSFQRGHATGPGDETSSPPHAPDLTQERGGQLDLDA